MARAEINKAKLSAIAIGGDGTMRALRKKAYEARNAAKEIFEAESVHYPQDPADTDHYMEKFEVYRRGNSYIVYNGARTAYWVEFGAHAGGKTPVLGYAPLRKAVDVIASGD